MPIRPRRPSPRPRGLRVAAPASEPARPREPDRVLRACAALTLLLSGACRPRADEPPAEDRVTLTIVGTSDLHGHLRALPLLAAHLGALRSERAADGGGVVLVDAGDMFQGTLESNLVEGASVVDAYAALGYDAVAVGNHEFDFGPVGPRATATAPFGEGEADPRGALQARIRQAPYPFLTTNLRRKGGEAPGLGVPSTLIERAGIKVGIVGVTTEGTPHTTIAANIADLEIAPLAASIAGEAAALRARGPPSSSSPPTPVAAAPASPTPTTSPAASPTTRSWRSPAPSRPARSTSSSPATPTRPWPTASPASPSSSRTRSGPPTAASTSSSTELPDMSFRTWSMRHVGCAPAPTPTPTTHRPCATRGTPRAAR
ncbi:metallophosphoesterase [Nannocystis pusilla]|uniref:metallophosphoesterase n=1 Tax=Nannocystis pusilla TaxID=889268 RepID=UPI003B765504